MDRKNLIIIALSVSAFLLMTTLALVQMFYVPHDTFAIGQQNGGDYVVTTARTTNGEEALWVLDARSRNVGIYQYDNTVRQLILRRVFPIAQAVPVTPTR